MLAHYLAYGPIKRGKQFTKLMQEGMPNNSDYFGKNSFKLKIIL